MTEPKPVPAHLRSGTKRAPHCVAKSPSTKNEHNKFGKNYGAAMTLANETPKPCPLEKALDLITELQRWADHKRRCSIFLPDSNPASDFCDCGYRSAMRIFEMQYRELRAIPRNGLTDDRA